VLLFKEKGEIMELVKRLEPAEYVLAVLPQEERLEITFKIAHEAFKGTTLSIEDIEAAVKKIRKRIYKVEKKRKNRS
jgi:hypothetical protein